MDQTNSLEQQERGKKLALQLVDYLHKIGAQEADYPIDYRDERYKVTVRFVPFVPIHTQD